MDSNDFIWLVFHPDGKLYYTTTAVEVERYGVYNRGGPVLKLEQPSLSLLGKLDNGKPCVIVSKEWFESVGRMLRPLDVP